MTEPTVSERMRELVLELLSATRDNERTRDSHTRAVFNHNQSALLSAIAEIEQRAEKAEQERDLLMQEPNNRLDGYRELGAKCAALEERNDVLKSERGKWREVAAAYRKWWDAYFEREKHEYPSHYIRKSFDAAQGRLAAAIAAIAALGDEWDEAVKGEGVMSHPYTDHYPMPGTNIEERLCDHEKRIKELESKLGAVDVGLSTDRKAVEKRPIIAGSPPAASSVSAEEWRSKHSEQARRRGWQHFARACDLAAAVTAWLQRHELDDSRDGTSEQFLFDTVFAFVRGEPLPQRGK